MVDAGTVNVPFGEARWRADRTCRLADSREGPLDGAQPDGDNYHVP
jgi:hypothetical protein